MAATLKITVVRATKLKETFGKGDGYVCFFAEGKWYETKVIKNSNDPEWNQSFDVVISDPSHTCITFNLWDKDTFSRDDLLGGCALSLSGVVQGEARSFDMQILSREQNAADCGNLTVSVESEDYTGLVGVADSLNETTQALKAEVEQFSAENDRYKELNDQLEATTAELTTQVENLSGEVDRFTEQNDRLEGEVNKLGEEVSELTEVRQGLEEQVTKLGGEVDRFTEQNDRLEGEVNKLGEENAKLEETRQALDESVEKLSGEVDEFTKQNEILQATTEELTSQVENLTGEVDRFSGEVDRLEETRKGLEEEVANLGGEVEKFTEENKKLEETREALETNVASLGNKVAILGGEIDSLKETREMLDAQVTRQTEQNDVMKEELGKLNEIKTGMEEFAAQQGEDYQAFVNNLTGSLERHEQLLEDFAHENDELRENRRKIQINSYVSMSNNFSNWDMKGGLSPQEFESYIELLGEDFRTAMLTKYEGTMESVFEQLDADQSGSLNIPEVKNMLNEIIEEEEQK